MAESSTGRAEPSHLPIRRRELALLSRFEGPYYVEAVMPDGVVTLAPGGFSRYRVPNVEGTLEALPVLGTVALAMDKGHGDSLLPFESESADRNLV